MADYRLLFDSEYIYAFHLAGREATLQIERVKGGEVTGEGGRKSKKPLVFFKGKTKPLALNKTNCKTIAQLYGTNTDDWIGKLIAIYPTQTQFGGEVRDCIRVRPQVPTGKAAPEKVDENREPGQDG